MTPVSRSEGRKDIDCAAMRGAFWWVSRAIRDHLCYGRKLERGTALSVDKRQIGTC